MYNMKLIITGDKIEMYKYTKILQDDYKVDNANVKGRGSGGDRNRKSTLHKAKTKIIRIVNSNNWTHFITLTFATNISIEDSKDKMNKFLKRVKYHHPNIKYLYVIELQQSGRPHFHLLVSEYVNNLKDLWGYGFINCKEITNKNGAGMYISKYITKDPIDTSCKLYGYSRNCNLPEEIRLINNQPIEEIVRELGKNIVYTGTYDIEITKNRVHYYVLEGEE